MVSRRGATRFAKLGTKHLYFKHFGAGCDGASGGDTTAAIDGDIIISEFVIEFCRPSPLHRLQADSVRHTTEA